MAGLSLISVFSSVAAIFLIYKIGSWLFNVVWWLALRPKANLKSYGKWALVTGCTNGIGEALTRNLAKQGFNVFLIGRNRAVLDTLQNELTSAHGIEAAVAVIDAAAPDATNKAIEATRQFATLTAKHGDRGIVINCAGLSYDNPEYFDEVAIERHLDIANINSVFLTAICHGVIPAIRNGGLILNVSSIGGAQEEPLLATYAASKAYVTNLSAALDAEFRNKPGYKIRVQALCPGMVVSNMSKVRKASLTIPTADAYAKAVLQLAGVGPSVRCQSPFCEFFYKRFTLKQCPLRECFLRCSLQCTLFSIRSLCPIVLKSFLFTSSTADLCSLLASFRSISCFNDSPSHSCAKGSLGHALRPPESSTQEA